MSPAGGWPQLKAAVANGADAVYLGLTSYSARARASNFDPDPRLILTENRYGEYEPEDGKAASLALAVEFAHRYNVRVYVAFNTLVFDEELHEVQELIEQIWDCGVDAVIIVRLESNRYCIFNYWIDSDFKIHCLLLLL